MKKIKNKKTLATSVDFVPVLHVFSPEIKVN
jgi:hypothetical protein